ncbi:Transthyretin-like family protein [Ancylostoma duodenale]|uniref:Transthyretin-like family protein n=1 Tax=Ancylostoma duodenale TaxID=51022 RepID=A0A0C2GDG7_9BILA|nr:Transthyretin-like family protein [Ancylostoma duodenale]
MQLIIFLSATLVSCLAIRLQSVGITGRLMCRDKPAAGVKIELWDRDDGPDPDDLLAKGVTDAIGNINLKVGQLNTDVIKS